MKKKKISFNYFLYKSKNPSKNELGENEYPIYAKVTYNKKSTRFPIPCPIAIYAIPNEVTEKDFDLQFTDDNGNYHQVEPLIEKVIRFEAEMAGESYEIKGISARFDRYWPMLAPIAISRVESNLTHVLGDIFSYNDYQSHSSILDEPYSFIEEELFDCVDFFIRYRLFDTNANFSLKEKFSKELISQIVSILGYCAYENYRSKSTTDIVNSVMHVFDWVVENKCKKDFKSFLESNNVILFADDLAKGNEAFSYVLKQYREGLKQLNIDDTLNLINESIQTSYLVRDILKNIKRK